MENEENGGTERATPEKRRVNVKRRNVKRAEAEGCAQYGYRQCAQVKRLKSNRLEQQAAVPKTVPGRNQTNATYATRIYVQGNAMVDHRYIAPVNS